MTVALYFGRIRTRLGVIECRLYFEKYKQSILMKLVRSKLQP